MTELQGSLIAIGGAIVVGVVSYNKWQEWRAKKSVDKAFSPLEEDVLMGGRSVAERQEPVLTSSQHGADSDSDDHYPQSSVGQTEAFIETVVKPFPLDTFIDCIIPIALEFPLRGEKIINAFHHFVW